MFGWRFKVERELILGVDGLWNFKILFLLEKFIGKNLMLDGSFIFLICLIEWGEGLSKVILIFENFCVKEVLKVIFVFVLV